MNSKDRLAITIIKSYMTGTVFFNKKTDPMIMRTACLKTFQNVKISKIFKNPKNNNVYVCV